MPTAISLRISVKSDVNCAVLLFPSENGSKKKLSPTTFALTDSIVVVALVPSTSDVICLNVPRFDPPVGQ